MKREDFLKQLNSLDLRDGNLVDVDAVALIEVAKQAAKPKCQFLEIGAWKGKSTACLAAVVAKENGTVWALDHFMGTPSTKSESAAEYTDVFKIFRNNMTVIDAWQSIVFAIVSPYRLAAELLPNNFFNFIYVDADNRYEEQKFVLSTYWKKLKSRGIICGRNLIARYPEVKTQVDEDINEEYSNKYGLHPGIIKAVHEVFKGNYDTVKDSSIWFKKKI